MGLRPICASSTSSTAFAAQFVLVEGLLQLALQGVQGVIVPFPPAGRHLARNTPAVVLGESVSRLRHRKDGAGLLALSSCPPMPALLRRNLGAAARAAAAHTASARTRRLQSPHTRCG